MILLIALRIVHIVLGAVWVGFVVFTTFYLMPAIQDAGPDGGKVMGALQRRGIMTITPILAIGTLLSGLALYWKVSGGFDATFMGSRTGMTLGLGAVFAIVAYAIGMTVMRPSMLRAATMMQNAAALSPGEREAGMAEAGRLRTRAAAAARLIAILLLLAIGAMAVARYV